MRVITLPPPVDCAKLLPGYHFADAYAIDMDASVNAIEATQRIFASSPRWIQGLMHLRNRLVGVVGLKPAPADGFPVIAQSATQVLLGFDDHHLDFRIAVTALPQRPAGRKRLAVTTMVRRHHLGGQLYLGLVLPFHRRIVPAMLRRSGLARDAQTRAGT